MTPDEPIHAKHSLGQNWLVNEGVLDRIVEAAGIRPDDTVLEVGPGKGALTRRLAQRVGRVLAVEKDSRLIAPLREQFISVPGVHIVEADILRFHPAAHALLPGAYCIVANIPYYLTSRLIRLMLVDWPPPRRAVLMVQYEVSQRILAQPPNMNLLALSVQLFARPSLVMRVSRGSFRPMPDVDSAVIILEPHPHINREESDRILALAKKAFATKRKQLSSSIPQASFEQAGVPRQARPQDLSVENWRMLANGLP